MHQEKCAGEIDEIRKILDDCRQALQQLVSYAAKGRTSAPEPRAGGYLNIRQASVYLGLNHRTLRRGLTDIECPLKHVRAGALIRFKREWLDEWVEKQAGWIR